jgi:hypothetical protein
VQVVGITAQGLCNLTFEYIRGSAKYQALSPAAKAAVDRLGKAACDALANVKPGQNPIAKAIAVTLYKVAVTALAQGGWLTPEQAATLRNLANQL